MKQLKIEGDNLNDILHECQVWHHNCAKDDPNVQKHFKMKGYTVTLSSILMRTDVERKLQGAGIYPESIEVNKPKSKQIEMDKPKEQPNKVVRGS